MGLVRVDGAVRRHRVADGDIGQQGAAKHLDDAGHDPADLRIGVTSHFYLEPTSQGARDTFFPYYSRYIGNNMPTVLMDYIAALEASLGITARKNMMPIQAGDMHTTAADTSALQAWVGFAPATPVREGVARFVAWYRGYYGV